MLLLLGHLGFIYVSSWHTLHHKASHTQQQSKATTGSCAGRKITTPARTIQGRDLVIRRINSSETFASIALSLHKSPSKLAEALNVVQTLLTHPCRLNTSQLWSTRHRGMSGQTCPEASEPVTEPTAVTTGQKGT